MSPICLLGPHLFAGAGTRIHSRYPSQKLSTRRGQHPQECCPQELMEVAGRLCKVDSHKSPEESVVNDASEPRKALS